MLKRKCLVYDYDETLVTFDNSPTGNALSKLVKSIKSVYDIPLIILTAGTIKNYPKIRLSKSSDRPVDLFEKCGFKVSENYIDLEADVCVFGRVSAEDNPSSDYCFYSLNGSYGWIPSYPINQKLVPLLNNQGKKKLGILYHLLNDVNIDPHILFVDDIKDHNIGRVFIGDNFAKSSITYFYIEQLLPEDVESECLMMAKSIKSGAVEDYLSTRSKTITGR